MHIIYVKNWFYPIFHTQNVTGIFSGLCLREVVKVVSFLREEKIGYYNQNYNYYLVVKILVAFVITSGV